MKRLLLASGICSAIAFVPVSLPGALVKRENDFHKEEQLVQKGDFDAVIENLTAWLKKKPDDAAAYSNRGMARDAKGDHEGAIADWDRAIAMNPKSSAAFNSRGNMKAAKGDLDGALAD